MIKKQAKDLFRSNAIENLLRAMAGISKEIKQLFLDLTLNMTLMGILLNCRF